MGEVSCRIVDLELETDFDDVERCYYKPGEPKVSRVLLDNAVMACPCDRGR